MSTTAAAPPPSYPNLHGRSFAITGGCGYVGHRIALHLLAHGATLVRRLDVMAPRPHAPSAFDPKPLGSETLNALFETRTEYERCDLRDREAVRRGLRGVDAVFHVASFGMSGRDMLNTAMVMAVNVDGTRHVLDAANELGVQAVCYTSTTNVCFSGRPLVNQDERLPYVPDHQHVDYYSRTKCIAEQLVLQAARDTSHTRAQALRTCAIRPAGIYGEAEERHLPRIVALMRRGLFCFTIGSPDSLVEFVYVDNLVHAHLLAVDKLLSSDLPSPPSTPSSSSSSPWSPGLVNGEAFFISDCQPINNFEFFRPLLLGLGYSYPRLRLPFLFMYYLAFMIEVPPSAPPAATLSRLIPCIHAHYLSDSLVACTSHRIANLQLSAPHSSRGLQGTRPAVRLEMPEPHSHSLVRLE